VPSAAGAAAAASEQLPELDGSFVVVVTGSNIDDDLLERACSRPESFRT
jgi:hypothetical protein